MMNRRIDISETVSSMNDERVFLVDLDRRWRPCSIDADSSTGAETIWVCIV